MRTFGRALGLIIAAIATTAACGAQAAEGDGQASYRIEFLGNDPPNDWARLASALVERNLAPIKTADINPKVGPCGTMLELLGFRAARLGCAASIDALLTRMNRKPPESNASRATTAMQFVYPDLPIEEMTYSLSFDRDFFVESDRYYRVQSSRMQFVVNEIVKGTVTQAVFRGFRTTLSLPDTPENVAFLRSLQRYDDVIKRLSVRIIRLNGPPALKSLNSMATPGDWFNNCRQHTSATKPKPHYAGLLGLASMPACVMTCTEDNCPEVVLVDGKAARHPDIRASFVQEEIEASAAISNASAQTDDLCPAVDFDKPTHHGTHLAGIIVSANRPDSFVGLSPAARLDTRAFDKMPDADLGQVITEKAYGPARLFVFASSFTKPSATPLASPDLRRQRPFFIEEILNGEKLWVVAAGNGPPAIDLMPNSPLSPMNVGDLKNVLVVTACENCYGRDAKIADWANYSTVGLVAIAAPGGAEAKPIPSTATDSAYAVAYGTSQAAAVVSGLASAMMTCFPNRYRNARDLKIRLQSAVRPPANDGLASKIATGVIDAEKALKDPEVHHVGVKGSQPTPKRVKELRWCRDRIDLIDPVSHRPLAGGTIDPRLITYMVRDEIPEVGPTWYVYYEPAPNTRHQAIVKRQGPGLLPGAQPLLRVKYEGDTQSSDPIAIDDLEFLLPGFAATNIVLRPGQC
jgi:subtilisin family serine protease